MRDEVIYDLGMNNGDDIEYYLKKGLKVVGIEANPSLVESCKERFEEAINNKRLVLENVAVAVGESSPSIEFYVHKSSHVSSTLVRPDDIENYDLIHVSHKSIEEIIKAHGKPYYLKVDIEHYDAEILKDLLRTKHRPRFISAESHDLNVFAALCLLDYEYFNLVNGNSVSTHYSDANIQTSSGSECYSFPAHSAGPFGEDISTPWMKKEVFMAFLAQQGFGWKDVHATNLLPKDAKFIEHLDDLVLSPRQNLDRIKAAIRPLFMLVPSAIKRIIERSAINGGQ